MMMGCTISTHTHVNKYMVCGFVDGLKPFKKARQKIGVLVNVTHLTKMYGGDAN